MQFKSITHYTIGKGSQGDCVYYNSDIIKIDIFQIIMENKDVLIYSKLFYRLGTNKEFIYINTFKLQYFQVPNIIARTKRRNKSFSLTEGPEMAELKCK